MNNLIGKCPAMKGGEGCVEGYMARMAAIWAYGGMDDNLAESPGHGELPVSRKMEGCHSEYRRYLMLAALRTINSCLRKSQGIPKGKSCTCC